MFFSLLSVVFSVEGVYYTDIRVPCNITRTGEYAGMDHCNVCATKSKSNKILFSCLICEDGYDLVYGDNKTYYYCEKATETPKPEEPKPETPKPEESKPDNCPPCVCDTALKSSTDQPTTTPSTTPDNSQMMLIMFIMTTIMFFMVSYIFCKEWKPIVCKCRRSQEYNALQLTPPPSPPPPEQPQSVLPRFIPTETRRSSSSTSEFSE